MRTYGYPDGVEENVESIVELQSIVIEVDETFLVALRDLAQDALDDMRRLGERYAHAHFQDKCKIWCDSWPDIVLTRPYSGNSPEAA